MSTGRPWDGDQHIVAKGGNRVSTRQPWENDQCFVTKEEIA